MGIMDFVRGQLIDIIEWTDESRDTLSYRFPDDDQEIKRGAQLIVRESQAAQFVYLGQFGDLFGPGIHRLTTDNIPVLSRLRGWKYGLESPFKADVYFVSTRLFAGIEWGTANPVMLHDDDFGIVRIRAFGTYDVRVTDVPKFLRNVTGTDSALQLAEFAGVMRARIVSAFSEALALARIPALDLARRYSEIGAALLPPINAVFTASYGIELVNLVIENVSVPPEVEQAIDKRSSVAAVGDLNEYVKYQIAQAFQPGAPAAAGAPGGFGAELAAGLIVAQQMLKQTGGLGGAGVAEIPETLSPAEAAKALGVTEGDVLASLESGDLKGRRIGAQWRITRAALSQFLQ